MRSSGRQRKATARGEVIGFRLSPEFDNDRIERPATRALKAGLKRVPCLSHAKQNHTRRIDPEFSHTQRGRRACLPVSRMPNPKTVPSARPSRQHQRATGKANCIRLCRGVDLVQPAFQHGK